MDAKDTGVVFRRNQLPQWRLDSGVYFVTWRLAAAEDRLSPKERSLVADELKRYHGERYFLGAFVVMDDHVHVLVQSYPGFDLSTVLQGWKGASSRAINLLRKAGGARWQKASRTDLMRNEAAIRSRLEYIWNNPRRRWDTPPEEYAWLEAFN